MLLESKLQKMKGKTFMYRTDLTKIIDYSITEENLFISTDKRLLSIKLAKAEAELDLFLPAQQEGLILSVKGLSTDPQWKTVKEVAHEMLHKLKTDKWKEHIDQARAVNESINTIVNVMKTEIDVAKLFNKGA